MFILGIIYGYFVFIYEEIVLVIDINVSLYN
jgi:hypothetical protein